MLGENIKTNRKKLSFTQDQLAEQMNVTRQTISKWELDQVQPDIDTLVKLADFFQVSLDELVRGEVFQRNATEVQSKQFSWWYELRSINWWVVWIFIIVFITSLKSIFFD